MKAATTVKTLTLLTCLAAAARGQQLQDFAIDHIELVQVVQNRDNTVPLVYGKSTVARVFLRSLINSPITSGISGTLTADGFPEVLHVFGRLPATAPVGTPDPDNAQNSLNFHLPPSWTVPPQGTLLVHASATLNGGPQKTQSAAVAFLQGLTTLRVFHVEVCLTDYEGNRQCPPQFGDVSEQLQKIYPIADGGVEYTPLATSSFELQAQLPDDSLQVTKYLKALYYLLEPGNGSQLFAWLPPVNGIVGLQSSGRVAWAPASCASDPCDATDLQALGVTLGSSRVSADSGMTVGAGAFDPKAEKVLPSSSLELSSGGAWPSAGTYTKLIVDPTAGRALGTAEYLIIGGTVSIDGTAGTLDPGYRTNSLTPGEPTNPAGAYCLRFSGGDPLDYCFDPNAFGGFEVKAPIPAGSTRVALISGGAELTALTASPDPPMLSIALPQAGDAWQDTGTIQWTGDALVYAVEYSPDNGASWIPLAIDLTDTQYQVDATRLSGGTQVLIRVLASNGLLTSTAVTGPINVMQAPALALDQTSLNFPNVTVGQVADVTMLLSNSGTGPLTASGLVSGDPFTIVTGGSSLVIPGGGQRAITVRFAPTSAGQQFANLTVSSTDPGLPSVNIPLSATAFNNPVPSISVSAASIDFGGVNFGQTSDVKFTINNAGSGPLNVNTISIGNPRFTVVSPSLPVAIAAGVSMDITVRFTPNAAGPVSGSLSISSNDPTRGTSTITLAGAGIGGPPPPPAISISPRSLDFGSLTIGQSSDSKFTITNTGTTDVTVSSITSGAAAVSILSPTGQFTVAAGRSVDVLVRFTALAAGTVSTVLTVGTTPSLTVSVTGSAVTPTMASVQRTIAYNEITAVTDNRIDLYNLPVISRSGNRAIFTADTFDLWTVNPDGSGLKKVDSFQFNVAHYLSVSDDGSTALVYGGGQYLRIVNVNGGDPLMVVTSTDAVPPIGQARLSGDGKTVFFVNTAASTLSTGTTSKINTRAERGIWAINTDGTNLREVIGSPAIAAALLVKDSDIVRMVNDLVFPGAFDVSTNGLHIVFGVETSTSQGRVLMAVNSDGTAPHKLRGGLSNLYTAAISGDGSTIAYTAATQPAAIAELDVIHFDGSGALTLSSRFGSFAVQLSNDGSQVFAMDSGKGELWRSDGSSFLQLFPPAFGDGTPQLAAENDTSLRASMTGDGTRFLFTVPNGLPQLATAEINPASLGAAPAISNLTINPSSVPADGQSNNITVMVTVTSATPPTLVNTQVFLRGVYDQAATVLSSTGGGTYIGTLRIASTVPGARTLRIKAENQDVPSKAQPAAKRHATAVEFGGFVITPK